MIDVTINHLLFLYLSLYLQIVTVVIVTVVVSMLAVGEMCVPYPNTNPLLHPIPNDTNITLCANYTGLSLQTFMDNLYSECRLYAVCTCVCLFIFYVHAFFGTLNLISVFIFYTFFFTYLLCNYVQLQYMEL